MNLQDLQQQWGNQYKGQENSGSLVLKLLIKSRQTKVNSKLNRLRFNSILFMLFNLLVIIYTWFVLAENFNNLPLAIPLIALLILSKITFYMNVWQLDHLAKINFALPITSLQKQISKLKVLRIKHNRFIFIFCNLYSWLMLSLLFEWNILSVVETVWENAPIVVIIHLSMIVLWFPLAFWLLHKYDTATGTTNFWTKLQKDSFLTDQSVNSSLNNINTFLDEIEEFEKE